MVVRWQLSEPLSLARVDSSWAVSRGSACLAHASPHAVVLSCVQREGKALRADRQPTQIAFACVIWSREGPDAETGKDQLRVCMPACGQLPPVPAGTVIISALSGLGGRHIQA